MRAEFDRINERLSQSQQNHESDKQRLNAELRTSERLRLENEQLRKDNEVMIDRDCLKYYKYYSDRAKSFQ